VKSVLEVSLTHEAFKPRSTYARRLPPDKFSAEGLTVAIRTKMSRCTVTVVCRGEAAKSRWPGARRPHDIWHMVITGHVNTGPDEDR
jgi:hypothetical protein